MSKRTFQRSADQVPALVIRESGGIVGESPDLPGLPHHGRHRHRKTRAPVPRQYAPRTLRTRTRGRVGIAAPPDRMNRPDTAADHRPRQGAPYRSLPDRRTTPQMRRRLRCTRVLTAATATSHSTRGLPSPCHQHGSVMGRSRSALGPKLSSDWSDKGPSSETDSWLAEDRTGSGSRVDDRHSRESVNDPARCDSRACAVDDNVESFTLVPPDGLDDQRAGEVDHRTDASRCGLITMARAAHHPGQYPYQREP